MADIVPSLFGLTPEMYGEQQRRSALQEGITLAQLDPSARGTAMTYAGARNFGNAFGGAMGVQDPQLQMISQRQQIIQQLDLTNPASLARGVDLFTRTGDIQAAQALAVQSQTIAKQNQDRLKSEAETRKLGAETTKIQSEDLAKQSQVRQLMSQFGMEETQATTIASNADLLKQYLTPKTQQGFELVKTGKFTPERIMDLMSKNTK